MTKLKRNLISAVFGWALFFVVLQLCQAFIPVVVFMQVERWERSRSNIAAEIVGYKLLDCQVVKDSFVGWVNDGDLWREEGFKFIADTTPNNSKPATFERQSFGVWQWSTQPRNGKLIKMTVQHNCDGRIRTTTVGPFEYQVNQ